MAFGVPLRGVDDWDRNGTVHVTGFESMKFGMARCWSGRLFLGVAEYIIIILCQIMPLSCLRNLGVLFSVHYVVHDVNQSLDLGTRAFWQPQIVEYARHSSSRLSSRIFNRPVESGNLNHSPYTSPCTPLTSPNPLYPPKPPNSQSNHPTSK